MAETNGNPALDPIKVAATPVGFSRLILGHENYDWQNRAIAPLRLATGPNARRINISVASPNGAGKNDRIIPGAAYWWVAAHKRGTVVITSKSDLQLSQQTIPALEKHRHKFPGYESVKSPRYELRTPTGGRIIAFVTNNPDRIEGWHKEDDTNGPLLKIVNEAKGLDDALWSGLDRWTVNAELVLSSPGLKIGRFWDTHSKLRAQYITVRAGLVDCPHKSKEQIDHIIALYGPDHPVTRSTLYGEFMDEDEASQFVFSLAAVQMLLASPPSFRQGSVAAFCDFAAGGDENVFALREGNRATIAAAWRERNIMAAVGRFILEFRKANLRPEQIWADEGGLGKPMCDALAEAGWEVNRVNFGATPSDERHHNRGSEIWHESAQMVRRGEVVLPADDALIAQLTTRKVKILPTGKLGLESKEDMRKRGLPSPDRADAVLGALMSRDIFGELQARQNAKQVAYEWEEFAHGGGVLAGANAGY